MKQRRLLTGLFAAVGMLLLILDAETSLRSAAEGMELCLRAVIPSLFPFFMLSGILLRSLMGIRLPLLRPLGKLLGMPEGSESLLICGFLGGYPVGAKSVRDAWAAGHLEKADAERMLSFCNNAGPAFLFGMAAPVFSDPYTGWSLWGIHILSALTAGILLKKEPDGRDCPALCVSASASGGINNALSVTAQVCGWVILFRVISGFLSRWFLWLFPLWIQTALTGFLELANGCLLLGSVTSEQMRFVLCSGMLSFGGVCVFLQTGSAARGLKLHLYIAGKLLQTGFAVLFSILWLTNPRLFGLTVPAILLLGMKTRKKCGNPETVGV